MRWALTLLAVIAAGVGVWLLDPVDATPPPAPGGAAAASGASANPSVGAASAEARPDGTDIDELAGDADDAAIDRERVDDLQQLDGPMIAVVRGDPLRPVPGVWVSYVDERDTRVRRNREWISRWETPERFGKRMRTDERGRVQLPARRSRWLCSAASDDGMFGFVAVAATPPQAGQPEAHQLVLLPDEQVTVQVRHHDGAAAAGIDLTVAQLDHATDSDEIWRGTSDANGRAEVRHVQLLRRPNQGEELRIEKFAVVARFVSDPPTLELFEGRPAQTEPVVLRLPPLARLQIQLTDHGGRPLLSPASVRTTVPRSMREGSFPLDTNMLRQSADKPATAEPVTLEPVAADRNVQLYVRYPHDRQVAAAPPTPTTDTPGGWARIEVPPHERHCVFAGRLVDAAGDGLAGCDADITIWKGDEVLLRAGAVTIADGRFDLVLSGRDDGAGCRMEFRAAVGRSEPASPREDAGRTPAVEQQWPEQQWLGAMVDLPAWPASKRIELGEVRLEPLPPLCAGVVVDDLGRPVANASVVVQQLQPDEQPAGGSRDREDLRRRVEVQFVQGGGLEGMRLQSNLRRNSGPRWTGVPNLDTRTGPDGRFRIVAPMPPGQLRVRADTREHFGNEVPLAGPDQELRIRIDRNGELRGTVLLPEWLPPGAITLTMQPVDETLRREQTRREGLGRGAGPFRIAPLMPGDYQVLVNVRNIDDPLATIEGVHVPPGRSEDPRLSPLDLRQSLFRYRLRAVDEAGQALALDTPILAKLHRMDGTVVDAGFRFQDGAAELITPHHSAELTFFGRGFAPMTQTYGPGDHQVYLNTLKPALVDVPGARALCGPTRKVRISAVLQGDTGLPSSLRGTDQRTGRSFSFARWDLGRSSGGWLEQTDLVQIPLMVAGRYQVILRAHATESTNTPQMSVTLGEFELRPGNLGTVTVPIPTDKQIEIEQGLRRVDQQHEARQQAREQRRLPGRPNRMR